MLDRLEIKNGAQDTNFQLCRLHIDLFHDDFWSGINNGSFLKKIKIMRGRPQGIVEALMVSAKAFFLVSHSGQATV